MAATPATAAPPETPPSTPRSRGGWGSVVVAGIVVGALVGGGAALVVARHLRPTSAPACRGPGCGAAGLLGKAAPDFTLVDQFGRRESLSAYRGKVVLLTFVSTRCTAICPLTAELLAQTQHVLGSDATSLQLVAVNANEVHRTVADVRHWSALHRMTDRWQFLTGSLHSLISVYDSYEITPGAHHTVIVYVIDPSGRVRTLAPIAMKAGIDTEARMLARYVRSVQTG